MMPFRRYVSSEALSEPNAGFTSSSAASKSCIDTLRLSSSMGLLRSATSTCRCSANETALFTSPSISAPEKFFVRSAKLMISTSFPRKEFSNILLVWILRICWRPFSSGSPISTCTSRRPGRSSASSSMSLRLVMPMSRMLFRESTPSTLVSSWLTSVSCTPVLFLIEPRCLQMASISSKMMMCSSLSSPRALYSASASANSARMFSSLCPMYWFRISGPFTILGSLPLSILPICRAMSVLPVPGGPYSSMPFTCEMPSFSTTSGGNTRDAKARRKISSN
mmetsp:Transcript_18438/g.48131  ORF Transcript_18438/g.48131 Transcript_18438/m.48131 type:complete len:280 (-) Transcript_18438:868-1707(-)